MYCTIGLIEQCNMIDFMMMMMWRYYLVNCHSIMPEALIAANTVWSTHSSKHWLKWKVVLQSARCSIEHKRFWVTHLTLVYGRTFVNILVLLRILRILKLFKWCRGWYVCFLWQKKLVWMWFLCVLKDNLNIITSVHFISSTLCKIVHFVLETSLIIYRCK